MDYEILKTAVADGIATVTISRPKAMNALNTRFFEEMDALVAEMAGRTDVKVIILTGEGKAFVAGADIAEMAGKSQEQGRHFSRARAEDVPQPRAPRQARDRGGQRLRPRRRPRAGHGLRLPHRERRGQVRPARGQPGGHPRIRRDAAPAPARRPGQRPLSPPDRGDDRRRGGPPHRPRPEDLPARGAPRRGPGDRQDDRARRARRPSSWPSSSPARASSSISNRAAPSNPRSSARSSTTRRPRA